MSQKKKKKAVVKSQNAYNGWRVLFLFIEGVFNLINNNKIYPVFGLLLISFLALIVWRLPDTDLGNIITILVNEVIVGKSGLISIIIFTNLGWLYLLKRMRGVYQQEIDRLASIRSDLMHGTDKSKIESHRSTKGSCEESYIVPTSNDENEDKK